MIEQLAERVNANAPLVRRGQYLDATMLLQIGTSVWLVAIEKGRIASVNRGTPAIANCTLAIRASDEAWAEFRKVVPKPGFHDLMALIKGRHMTVDGDIRIFMSHLRYFKETLGSLREARS